MNDRKAYVAIVDALEKASPSTRDEPFSVTWQRAERNFGKRIPYTKFKKFYRLARDEAEQFLAQTSQPSQPDASHEPPGRNADPKAPPINAGSPSGIHRADDVGMKGD